jgi:hypothetical protein
MHASIVGDSYLDKQNGSSVKDVSIQQSEEGPDEPGWRWEGPVHWICWWHRLGEEARVTEEGFDIKITTTGFIKFLI